MSDATEEAILRGKRAEQLLSDPLMVEAFALIEADLTSAWRQSPARDTEGREHLWTMLRLLDKLRGVFAGWAESGKVSAHNLALSEAEKAANR